MQAFNNFHKFQSTRPRGARPTVVFMPVFFSCFNPRARGGRDFQELLKFAGYKFQSTRPRGARPIRIKLSATSLDQLFADEVVHIRKAVQIRHLPPNQLPRREAFSLLLEQPF